MAAIVELWEVTLENYETGEKKSRGVFNDFDKACEVADTWAKENGHAHLVEEDGGVKGTTWTYYVNPPEN